MVSLTPRPLCSQGKSPQYTLDRRLGEPRNRPGHHGEEKRSLATARNRTPAIDPVAYRYNDRAIPQYKGLLVLIYNVQFIYFLSTGLVSNDGKKVKLSL
jgi:hypothetical protein